jgi:hypothetical protein
MTFFFRPLFFLPDGPNVDQRLEIEDRTDDAIIDLLSTIFDTLFRSLLGRGWR